MGDGERDLEAQTTRARSLLLLLPGEEEQAFRYQPAESQHSPFPDGAPSISRQGGAKCWARGQPGARVAAPCQQSGCGGGAGGTALRGRPSAPWVGRAVLGLRCCSGSFRQHRDCFSSITLLLAAVLLLWFSTLQCLAFLRVLPPAPPTAFPTSAQGPRRPPPHPSRPPARSPLPPRDGSAWG